MVLAPPAGQATRRTARSKPSCLRRVPTDVVVCVADGYIGGVPRRSTPDPLAAKIGRRVRTFRVARGYTLERLAFEGGLSSKGHLSDLENGHLIPPIGTLQALATQLGIDLLDLVTFPDTNVRHRLVANSAALPVSVLHRWCEESGPLAVLAAPTKTPKRAPAVVLHAASPAWRDSPRGTHERRSRAGR